ncbi:MAG: hypothetical protein MH137_06765 [Flavobacteriales bacterium]|nr:hypothetical protein [Flavobacteriales bacterium]
MQTTLFISIGKLILGTGLLYLLYILLLKKRLNGNYARLFLILGTVIFTLSPFLPMSLLNKEEIYLITLPEINLQNGEDITSDNSGEISFGNDIQLYTNKFGSLNY